MNDKASLALAWSDLCAQLGEGSFIGEVEGFILPTLHSAVVRYFDGVGYEVTVSSSEPNHMILNGKLSLSRFDGKLLSALQLCLKNGKCHESRLRWTGFLLKKCELLGPRLEKVLAKNGMAGESRRLLVLWLCVYFLEEFYATNDVRTLNVVLKLIDLKWLDANLTGVEISYGKKANSGDLLVVFIHALMFPALELVAVGNRVSEVRYSSDSQLGDEPELPMRDMFEEGEAPKVVVLSPSVYSKYTLAVLELLKRQGVCVQGVAVRSMVNRKRFIQEFRRDGKRLIRKVWNKLVLRDRKLIRRPYATLTDLTGELGLGGASVKTWAHDHGARYTPCEDLNDTEVTDLLKSIKPDAVVFTGGGMIRQDLLDAAGAGVINTHMATLPRYRGMDVVEWSILEGWPNRVGLSVHFMVKGLDEGDIIRMYGVPVEGVDSIMKLRERLLYLMPFACVESVLKYLMGEFKAQSQQLDHGQQYFVMHDALYSIAQKRYSAYLNSVVRSKEIE